MKSVLKIAILFTHLLWTLVSFAGVLGDASYVSQISDENFQIELAQNLSSSVTIQNQNHQPLSSLPFLEQMDMELEPDEEEPVKKHVTFAVIRDKEYDFYSLKSPPVCTKVSPESFVKHNPIYILLEVFRL